jgi:hypothetical protein
MCGGMQLKKRMNIGYVDSKIDKGVWFLDEVIVASWWLSQWMKRPNADHGSQIDVAL